MKSRSSSASERATLNPRWLKFKKEGESTEDEGLMGQLKGIKHSMREFKELLVAGGILEAVKHFFEVAIDAAEKSTDATDTSAAAVREFAKGLKDLEHTGSSVAVTVVGTFNKLGAAIGDVINITRSFITNGTQGFEVWAKNADLVASTGAAAEAAEKRLAEVRLKNGAEFLSITKELADIEKKARDDKLKGLDVYETEKNTFKQLADLRAQLEHFSGTEIERRRLILDIAKTELLAGSATLEVKKAQVDVEKKLSDERKADVADALKFNEQLAKEDADQAKRKALSLDQERELFTLQSKRADTLTRADRERLAILQLQTQQKDKQVDIGDLLEKSIVQELTPAEKARLAELIKQDQKLQDQLDNKAKLTAATARAQLAAEQAITAEIKRQADEEAKAAADKLKQAQALEDFYKHSITQKGDVRNLSDTQLDQLVQNLKKSIAPIAAADAAYFGVGNPLSGNYKSVEQTLLQENLTAALKEMNLRLQFKQTASFFGGDTAERNFAPDDFARLSQLFNPDQQKKDSTNLSALAVIAANTFTDAAKNAPTPIR